MVQTSDEIGKDLFSQPTIKETGLDFISTDQNSVGFMAKPVNLNFLMEIDCEDQLPPNVTSISGVSKEQFKEDFDSMNCYSRKESPQHNIDSEPNKTVINGATAPETKTGNFQIVSQLTPNIMSDSIFNETVTKAKSYESSLLSTGLPPMKVQRQSSLQRNSPAYTKFNTVATHITKEKMKTQDFDNVVNSDNARDCVNNKGSQHSNDFKSAEGFVVALPEVMTCSKEVIGEEELCEALDLSLPKKKVRDDKKKCKWVLDSGYEGPLLMEVDEIVDDAQHTEVDEDDEECWYSLQNDVNHFHLENWDQLCSVSHLDVPSQPCSSLSTDQEDTLLIDDQGIPYTLTPDGQKVPQIDPSEVQKVAPEESGPGQFDIKTSGDVQGSDSAQEPFVPNLSGLSKETSQATLKVEKSSHDTTAEFGPSALPAISGLPSLPIQIVASNTASNTPILLLPPSQLQTLSSSASNANPGVVALSLPLALAQNAQSTPVFLVLSSNQVACGIQSSLQSGQISQKSSPSGVALPSPAGSLGLNLGPVSCTTSTNTTNLSGQTQPSNFSLTPTSLAAPSSNSSVDSASPVKQLKSDSCSDMPTSFREALLRLAVTAEQKNEHQAKSIEAPALTTMSFSETTQPYSPLGSNTLEELDNTEEGTSPNSETASISAEQTDSLLSPVSTESLPPQPPTSPSCPASPIFPTNHPKNQDSQALGPRRILYCQYCPRVFYYLSDLERHSITHSQSKPHVCQLCGKAFKRSSHLERHKHIHTGQRNFVCQLCPRRFREAAELTRHQRVHTGEKPFQCLLCHMRFAERNTLRRHTKRKHQGQQQEAMNMDVKPDTEGISLIGIHQEENAEWYSSTMTEMESDSDTGGE